MLPPEHHAPDAKEILQMRTPYSISVPNHAVFLIKSPQAVRQKIAVKYLQEDLILPAGNLLLVNYPNPFSLSTTIQYKLPDDGMMQIAFYNAMGMKMQTLATGVQTAGVHTINADLNGLKSGVVFLQIDKQRRSACETICDYQINIH